MNLSLRAAAAVLSVGALSFVNACTAVPHGRGDARLAGHRSAVIDSLLRSFVGVDAPGASVLVEWRGAVRHAAGYGVANLEASTSATSKTLYRVGSVGKPITALVILQLAQRGLLRLDDPASRFLPGMPAWADAITIRHLLTHTSGVVDYGALILPTQTEPLTDAHVLELLRSQDTLNALAQGRFRYSNSGYVLLALIAERASGLSFEDLVLQSVARPAGMPHATYFPRMDATPPPERAFGYSGGGGAFSRTDQSLTSSIRGDGSIYASVEDLAALMRAVRQNSLLPSELQSQALSATAWNQAGTVGYGFGWFLSSVHGRRTVWHGGVTMGFQAALRWFRDDDLVVVILSNGGGDGSRLFAMADHIASLYLR